MTESKEIDKEQILTAMCRNLTAMRRNAKLKFLAELQNKAEKSLAEWKRAIPNSEWAFTEVADV